MEFLTLTAPYLIIFYLAVLLFIRPSRPAWLASLLGGLVLGILNLLVDIVAYYAHWWHYTFKAVTLQGSTPAYLIPVLNALSGIETNLHISLPFYLSSILIFGSLAYLCSWRFWRGRSRWFAIVVLIATPLFCIVRDVSGGVYNTSFQIWDNSVAAPIATIAMWLIAFFAGLLLFWRLAPARLVDEDESATLAALNDTQTQLHKH